MSVIKAPYNFVPLNSKVVEPYWAPFISHDIPFKDGRSGTLQVTLKTYSPLFIRDPEKKEIDEDKKDKVTYLFSHTEDEKGEKKYFIPGSSLKGMIRSVMEIMTFSRMKMVNDHKFAYRDFHNKRLYDVSGISKTAESGWLYRDEHGEYHLEECGVPGRVRMDELDKLGPQSSLYSFFTKGEPGFGFNPNKDQHKSAKFKYDQFSNPHPRIEVIPDRSGNNSRHDYRDKYEIKQLADDFSAQSGNKVGTLVLTGQPDARKEGDGKRKPSGKVYEFVFWDPINTIHFGNRWGEEPKPIKDMKWAYLDQKNTDEQSIDWKYFKEKLENGEKIPVFYHKRGSEITSMGLSLLYKFATSNPFLT
jgi:CRISPR-associated protein (TIGR03986 family)